ncbi:MAG: molecular chaperone DnaK [Desulfuromonas sp.]|nr:MAG: molecular chaperone DnaK [Desulfuromonas sp.]
MTEFDLRQIDEIKALLLTRRAELERLIENSENGSKPVSLEQPIGRLSRMDALQQQSMSQASQQVAAQRLKQIRAALQRIESEAYGFCLECEEAIELARLKARPEAPFCIDCQTSRERKS